MNNSVQQTAHAFVTLYKALPEEVREAVRRLMEKLDKTEFETTDAWQHLSQVSFANERNKPENAYWNIYLATPNSISKGEQTGEPIIRTTEKEQVARVQQMENIIAPLRVPLPADYKFDREESNDR